MSPKRTASSYILASGLALLSFLFIVSRSGGPIPDDEHRLLRKEPPITTAQEVSKVLLEESLFLLVGFSLALFFYMTSKREQDNTEPAMELLAEPLIAPDDVSNSEEQVTTANFVSNRNKVAPQDLELEHLAFLSLMRQNNVTVAREVLIHNPRLPRSCYHSLVRAFCKQMEPASSEKVIELMRQQNYNVDAQLSRALVHSFAKSNQPERAEKWLETLLRENSADLVSFSVVINAFGRLGNITKIEEWVDQARSHRFALNRIIYSTIINACSKTADIGKAEEWFADLQNSDVEPDQIIWNTIIKTCARAGNIERMNYWVKRMKESGCNGNVLTYTSVIQASSKIGDVELGKASLKEMRDLGLVPDQIVYNSLLYGCEMAGDVNRAEEIVKMLETDGLKLDHIGYRCIIKAITKRATDQDEVQYWTKRMHRLGLRNVNLQFKNREH
eukprot:GEMP01019134.1.p1 GENE.GEMP01019134.1~~GEMP01019134.1.p1  ORF type:complete len:445 (-),score=77.82 GEMP01019134.1:812-2146(-)